MKPTEAVFLNKTQWYYSKEVEKWLLVAIDVIAIMTAIGLAQLMAEHRPIEIAFQPWWAVQDMARLSRNVGLLALTVGAFWIKGHYSKRRPFWDEIKEIFNIVFVLTVIDAAMVFLGNWHFSRAAILVNCILAPCLLVLMRGAIRSILISIGGWIRPIVIIGWGENAIDTARAFDGESMMGFNLTAFLIPDGKNRFEHNYKNRSGDPVPCISLGIEPERTLSNLGNPHIVVALEQDGMEAFQGLIQKLSRRYQDLHIVPSLRGLPLLGMEITHFFRHEVLLLSVRNNLARRGPQLIKRCFDIFASLCLLIIGLPIFLVIGMGVVASGRPIFYGHNRVGRNGRTFPCYKFRTMLPNSAQLLTELLARDPEANAEWQRDFKLKNDPRITPFGHFLRKSSLDELPQLWNVLKGDMSLVGPRPIVNAELVRYGDLLEYYLQARPGITGLWQVSGRNDVTYATRVYLDSWYVKNWSLFTDIVILCKTLGVLLKRDGAY